MHSLYAVKNPANSQSHRGFTLIEVMLVLVIMAMLAGTVTIGIGQRSSLEFSSEVARLQKMLQQASDRALMQQELIGLFTDGNNYGFKRMDAHEAAWKEMRLSHWQMHNLPANMELEIQVEDENASGSDSETSEAVLMFLPDGQYTAFSLKIESKNRGARSLSGDGFAPISIGKKPDDA